MLTPPVFKSYCRIPEFSHGRPYVKVISIALHGLEPFMLSPLYLRPGFFGVK